MRVNFLKIWNGRTGLLFRNSLHLLKAKGQNLTFQYLWPLFLVIAVAASFCYISLQENDNIALYLKALDKSEAQQSLFAQIGDFGSRHLRAEMSRTLSRDYYRLINGFATDPKLCSVLQICVTDGLQTGYLLTSPAAAAGTNHYLERLTSIEDTLRFQIRKANQRVAQYHIAAVIALVILLGLQALFVFEPMLRRLNRAMVAKTEFLSRLSHEIRNPMNSVIGMADLLRNTQLNSQQMQYVENLTRSGQALLDLLNGLLEYSSLECKKIEYREAPFDLFKMIEKCVDLTSISAHNKSLDFVLVVDSQLGNNFIGDAVKLQQIVMNLIGNAIKFTEHGFVKLIVQKEAETASGARVLFAVEDSGIGIQAKKLKDIFESFTQGSPYIKRKYGGSGLGLSIANELASLIGTQIEVESEVGRGSRFFFRVYLKKQEGIDPIPLQQLRGTPVLLRTYAGTAKNNIHETVSSFFSDTQIVTSQNDFEKLLNELESQPTVSPLVVLVDDAIGIVEMIKCIEAARRHPRIIREAIAVIRTTFSRENLELIKHSEFRHILFKPLKPWELLQFQTAPSVGTPQNATTDADERDRPIKVLAVDDSIDNLFLIQEFLRSAPVQLKMATNGEECLRLFQTDRFDLVFMDIQMPIMDGYTTVSYLRNLEKNQGLARTPVVAISAHTTVVGGQQCGDAGFDEFLEKPISRIALRECLRRRVGMAKLEDHSRSYNAQIQKVLPHFFQARIADLRDLSASVNIGDVATIQRIGHKLKGSARTFGFPEISELGQKLEEAAGASDFVTIRELVVELKSQLERHAPKNQGFDLPTTHL